MPPCLSFNLRKPAKRYQLASDGHSGTLVTAGSAPTDPQTTTPHAALSQALFDGAFGPPADVGVWSETHPPTAGAAAIAADASLHARA